MRDIYTFDITPIGKPRMTQRDKWKNTRTQRADNYFVYRDSLQMLCLQNKFKPSFNMRMVFLIPYPRIVKVISLNERAPHMQKPDTDNLVKAFLDSVMENDATVWHIDAYKFWTDSTGRIEVEHL